MKNPFLLWNKLRGIISNEKKENLQKKEKLILYIESSIFSFFSGERTRRKANKNPDSKDLLFL